MEIEKSELTIKNDNDYITEYNLLEKDFDKFYNVTVDSINIYYFYINKENQIYNVDSECETLNNSCLSKERIIYLIKKKQYKLLHKHKLIGFLKFNIDFDFTDLNNFLSNKLDSNYLIPLKKIDDIIFNNTINILQDLNSIIFIFSNNITQNHNTTKKIIINTNKSKTRRHNNWS